MKTFVLVFIASVFALVTVFSLLAAKTSYAATNWGYLVGNVYDSADGHPLEKATVTATGNGYTQSKKTNSYGAWGMSLPVQGNYTVTISKSRYITQTLVIYAGSSASPTETFLIRK